MRRPLILLSAMVVLYVSLIFPFVSHMKKKPFIEKLGYVPKADILRLAASEYKEAISASLIMKAIIYYGGIAELLKNKLFIPPDYRGMYDVIDTALKLDPYNTDGYYFAQAILVWDVRQIRLANELLEAGMKYRDWDFYLPFFAGFNYSFFLKDYEKASYYYKRTAELTGGELSFQLAGRYMYEAGKTEQAIAYLSVVEKGTKNEAIKKSLQIRISAFKEIKRIEEAVDRYRKDRRALPGSMEELLNKGYLKDNPVDPYGGSFLIDKDGRVRTTSKFAFVTAGSVESHK